VWELSEEITKDSRGNKRVGRPTERKEGKASRKQTDSVVQGCKKKLKLEGVDRRVLDTGALAQSNVKKGELNESFYFGDEEEEDDNEGDLDGGDDNEEKEEESHKGMNLSRRFAGGTSRGEKNNPLPHSHVSSEQARIEISPFGQQKYHNHHRRPPSVPHMGVTTPTFPVKMEVQSFADRVNCWNMTSAAAANLAPVLYGMPLAAYYANPMACLLNPSAATSLRQVGYKRDINITRPIAGLFSFFLS